MNYKINFVCRSSKAGKSGLAPVEMTICCKSKRVFLSLPTRYAPEGFKKEYTRRSSELRQMCNAFEFRCQKAALDLVQSGQEISASLLKDKVIGKVEKPYTVGDMFKEYLAYLRKKIDIDITFENYKKYALIPKLFNRVAGDDFPVSKLTRIHGESFVLEVQKAYRNGTVKGKISKMKCILKWGREYKGIEIPDIFAGLKVKINKPEGRKYLTEEELKSIEDKHFSVERLEKVKDLFLFQSYTGLAYKDMAGIRKEDIQVDADGRKFIAKERCKTDIRYTVLLLPKAIGILEKYDYRLPVLSNMKYNSYLKEIADVCGVGINLTSHCGRHTCATYLLNHGIPIEIVAKVLGHSSTRITQSTYAKMLDKTVLQEMSKMI